jgi:hypothetical protein
MSDWKQQHANEAEKALDHALVKNVIEEQMQNLGTDNALVRYGLTKIAMYAASVARAQALGIDPDELRHTPEEARASLQARARAAVGAGVPTLLVDERGVTRLD